MASGSHGYSRSCNGLARLSGMAVIRLSMHAYYRPAGDCACTAKTLDEAVQDLGAVENIVRDFGDANPTMLPWRSLAGVIAHLAADPVRSRTLIGEEIRRGANPLRCCATSPGIDRDRRTVAWSTPGSHHRVAEHRGIARTGARFTPAWAAGFGTQISASRPALNWESLWTWRIGAEPPERKLTSGRSWRATTRSVLTGVGSLTPTELRVAQLAPQGISNSGIAEQTFASRNTRGMALAQYLPQARNRVPRPAADTHQRLNPPRLRRRRPLKPFTPGANPLRRGWRCRPRGFLGSRS